MTNVIFSRSSFEKHIKLTPDIQEKITLFGTPLENITQDAIEIEVFPNRPDLIPLEGFIRSFKKFLGKEVGLKNYTMNKPEKNYKVVVDKVVKEVRPYTACAIVKKLNLTNESIQDIINVQEKLALTMGRNRKKMGIGIYPLDKIILPITYTAKDPKDIKYQPLTSPRELSAKDILLLHPMGKKYEHLLKDHSKYPVFIDAQKQIMSMPPIVNSEYTGRISLDTKEVFIECTGTDRNTVEKALNIIVTSLADLGGKVYQMEIVDKEKYLTPNLITQKMKVSKDNVNKLLGLNLTEQQIGSYLGRMGHNYKSGAVEIASWRTDILHEVDIIEDIAIAYGYHNFTPEIPNISTPGEESKESIIKRKISDILLGMDLLEISTYHLVKDSEVESYKLKELLELEDSKTEYKFLRPNLLIPLLRILGENKDAQYPQKLFEIGRVFSQNSQRETGVEEKEALIIGITPANFTTIKQHVDYLFKMLKLEYTLKESTHDNLIDGRTGAILLNNRPIGYIGEIHPNTLRQQGINMPLAVAEIYLDEIFRLIN